MFDKVFGELPASSTTCEVWARADKALLDAAAAKIADLGANPLAFTADYRHFWQFAGAAEWRALDALTPAERIALLGEVW